MVRIMVKQVKDGWQAHYQQRGRLRDEPQGAGRTGAEAIGDLMVKSNGRHDVTLRGRVRIEAVPLMAPASKLAALGDDDESDEDER